MPPKQATSGQPRLRATDIAYQRLTEAIVNLELPPGQLVNERTLSERYGISRLTLLQALHRLAETGLVSVLPRRGIMVAAVDVFAVQQVFEARLLLEPKLAEMAALRGSPDHLASLRSQMEAAAKCSGAEHRAQSFQELDERLHIRIGELAQNPFLAAALQRTWTVNRRLWNAFFSLHGEEERHMFGHDDIVAAIESRDPEASREAMLAHLSSAKTLLQNALWGDR